MSECDKLRQARTQLVAQHPFFATLVLSMDFVEVEKGQMRCDTMGTDGKRLFYVREWVEKLTLLELMGVLVHEALHAALLHPFRCVEGNFRPDKANIAMDLAINWHIKKEGFMMPGSPVTWEEMIAGKEGHLLDARYADKAFEEIYRLIPDPPEQPSCNGNCKNGKGGAGGKGKCNCPGGVKYEIKGGRKGLGNDVVPNDSTADEAEAKIAVQKAVTVARQQGKLPSGMEGLLKDLLEPKLKWFDILRWWMKSKRKDDYDPRKYNRRMTSFGVYLPTLYSEGMGPMVVVRDTSGSCLGDQEEFLAEIAAIMTETKPDKLILIDCDAAIYADGIHEFHYNEGDLLVQSAKQFRGGGGTSFVPPFDWIKQENIKPEVLVFLTDMYGTFPKDDPGFPVMWVHTADKADAPFGMVLPLHGDQKK
jgi:predicted metal-dependent peptidase